MTSIYKEIIKQNCYYQEAVMRKIIYLNFN